MEPSKFDELTKALATPSSRRQALRRIGGLLGGTALAGLFPGLALASNSACAHFCASVFGADTKAADQCTSDAAHHKGLCYTCGPASPGGTQPICCPQNANGTCSSYSSATCCSNSQLCQNGTCITCATDACSVTGPNCGAGDCGACVQSVEGGIYCSSFCGGCAICASDSDCGPGFVCVSASCCGSTGGTACLPATCACTGCFTAGTLVAMANGTSRPIEHVLVGDLVLGHAGRVNRVTEIQRPLLGQRPLYALNGSNSFVTAGHPFLTEAGWKSIDPAATALENPALHVERLTVGDRLLTLKAAAVPVGAGGASGMEAVDVRIEAIGLQSLLAQPADPATQLYNLQLDGDHTYFANDLLVHNK